MEKVEKRVTEDAKRIASEKKELKAMYEKLTKEQLEINEQVNNANKIKENDDNEYRKILEEVGKRAENRREEFNTYKTKRHDVLKDVSNSKKEILSDLEEKKKVVEEYINTNLNDVDMDTLKKEEERLRNNVRLIRVTQEEFSKLTTEQQEIVVQAQTDYEKNSNRLNEVRKTMKFLEIIGDKNPENLLKDINYALEKVNESFDLENIDKLVSFKLEDRTVEQEPKDENKDVEKDSKETSGKQDKEKDEKIDNPILNKIESNKKDILKYMKLIEKYKDNPERCKDFKRAISDIQSENRKLYEELNGKEEKKDNVAKTVNTVNRTVNKREDMQLPEVRNVVNSRGEAIGIEQKEILGIEQKDIKRPAIVFDRRTGNYTYFDEQGNETEYDFYYQRKDEYGEVKPKYYDKIEKSAKKHMREYAMKKGLTKKEAKMMDDKIYRILVGKNPELLDKYIESLKGNNEFDKGFDITYDLRKKDREIERNIGFANIRNVMKKAKAHEKIGIATVYKDKSRALFYGILAAMGVSTIAGAHNLLNSGDEGKPIVDPILENTQDLANGMKENDKDQNKDERSQREQKDRKEVVEEMADYVKVAQGAMLFKDPTDELRVMSGLNANEKVTIKGSSADKLYKVTKVGYYSKTGEYITVEPGESLEEALAKKGLDISFIQEGNTSKMYHVVAQGVAEWVNEEDIEKVEVRTDKFGNPIDKTEEEKEVETAYENYMQQNSKTYQEEQSQR